MPLRGLRGIVMPNHSSGSLTTAICSRLDPSAACAFLLRQVKRIGQFALDFLDQPGVFKELDQLTRSHCKTLSEEVGYSEEGSSRAGASRPLPTHACNHKLGYRTPSKPAPRLRNPQTASERPVRRRRGPGGYIRLYPDPKYPLKHRDSGETAFFSVVE